MTTATFSGTQTSVLKQLRAVTPRREHVSFDEALRVAELQASKLHELLGADTGIQEADIAGLPRIEIVYEHIDVSGMSYWNGQQWLIVLNKADGWTRQRFTLCHEFKHIIDHGHAHSLYSGRGKLSAAKQAERAADYFAGCALVPRRQLKAAWGQGTQRIPDLATHFGVSEDAMTVRLSQTGLSKVVDREPPARCARPISTAPGATQRFRTARRFNVPRSH